MGDTGNAFLVAIAIAAALYHRDRTGVGQAVSTSIVNAGLLHASYAWIDHGGNPAEWGHVDGGQHGLGAFYRLYECAEETWLFLCAPKIGHRQRLADLLDDQRVMSATEADVTTLLELRFRQRVAMEWCSGLDRAGVPAEEVNEAFCRELFDDVEARKRGLIVETSAGGVGRFEDAGLLVHLDATPGVVQRGPCLCGQHSREILTEMGYDDAQIDLMAADRAILDATEVPS
jgi:crotonobetainyl-CoA:carnitine CoA-transferase CaiB-like acyl-CoA transferase